MSERFTGGVSTLVLGPPGTGKSKLLGSAAEHGKAVLLALRANEPNSWAYTRDGLDISFDPAKDLFVDSQWQPDLDMYQASAAMRLIKRLYELQEDEEFDFVLIDPLTDLSVICANMILAKQKVGVISDLDDSRGAYGRLRDQQRRITKLITSLQYAKKPKHVLVACHVQPAKEDERGNREVTFSGEVLAALDGSYREHIAGEFQLVLHTRIEMVGDSYKDKEASYKVEVASNVKRHNKVALAPALKGMLDNDYGTVMEAVLGA
jgi:hypothetical protein